MNLVSSFLGGIVAWFLTTILFQPYLKFINLRKETLRLVALYEPRFAYPRWFAPVDDERRRP